MNRVATAAGIALVMLSALTCYSAQAPGPAYEHLKFLEPFVGNWKVVTTEGDKVVSDGQETSEWIFNKNFMRHTGWGQHQGKPVQYEFYTGWDPKERRVFQWAVGATDTGYGIISRVGGYDPEQKVWKSRERTTLSDAEPSTSTTRIRFRQDGTITIDFSDRRSGDTNLPDHHDTFTKAAPVAAPDLDSAPGPGYAHLRFLEFSVGKWKLEGKLPEVGLYVGEEVNEWVFDSARGKREESRSRTFKYT